MMAGNFLLTVPSNFESPLMYEVSDHQMSSFSNTESSVSSLGSSVTACKKVLCSNSPLESIDYWLQNQKTLCRISFVEDKSENSCGSISFVNLDVSKEDYSLDILCQKLITISPDLPKFISSVNVQQPKENEIVLLSGLTSGSLQAGFEVPQCSWLADVCLVQCARRKRENNTACIIFEINKFLIGLQLVQERQVQLDVSVLKPEEDTNCSLSSIEEDFLTASEHFEDENETEENKYGQEKFKDLETSDVNKSKAKGLNNLQCKQGRLPFVYEINKDIKDSIASGKNVCYSEGTLHDVAEDLVMKSVDKAVQHLERTLSESNPLSAGTHIKESCNSNVENSSTSSDFHVPAVAEEQLASIYKAHPKGNSCCSDTQPYQEEKIVQEVVEKEEAMTGQFATNLAESVLQDAFIRLSQSDPTFTEEAAVCVSARDTLISASKLKEEVTTASRSWNELPKIVIVQSPDSYENALEWAGPSFANASQRTDVESSTEVLDSIQKDFSSITDPQSMLEVALACAATVIGTITSPHAAERIKLEHKNADVDNKVIAVQELQSETLHVPQNDADVNYTSPSAVCDMTQVASAITVCGLGETKEAKHCRPSRGHLSVADASSAITLLGVGSSMEKCNDSIAKVLLQEASIILTEPNTYRNVKDFMESMNGRIIESVASPKTSHLDKVNKDELVQTLSNVIVKHSVDEADRKKRLLCHSIGSKSNVNVQSMFMETASELLFNVIYSTSKKMSDIVRSSELSSSFSEDGSKWGIMEATHSRHTEGADSETSQQQLYRSTSNQIPHLYNNNTVKKEFVQETNANNVIQEVISDNKEKKSFDSELAYNNCNSGHNSLGMKTSTNKWYIKDDGCKPQNQNKEQRTLVRENTFTDDSLLSAYEQVPFEATMNTEPLEKQTLNTLLNNEFPVTVSVNNHVYPSQPGPQVKHTEKYYVSDFADEIAETVVSMATEIAAICLENSNGKQPWFCAWKQGNEYLMAQSLSCRTMKRKKEAPPNGSVMRKHRPPRLSEIKKKTDEHPELKERLMNRVVDESINLDDAPDSVSMFANEVTSKIMNLSEQADSAWQGQNHSRNRLHCERWSRGKASSYESIPEEDSDSKNLANTLGPLSIFGQSISRASSISKQSSCESITDEFSRFMVNQMENEGREFDLLLDYYAGKNANNILNSAMQQVTRKNGHLNVRPNCPSKQSSTESITEEFYRYMLREIDKENISSKNRREWNSSLLPPSPRSPFCFRQSSMPDSRSSSARLTVNAPVKANSLDGFARDSHLDFLNVQPVSTVSYSGLCKSDSCLYQRCKMDQITDMLIHETWSNSIEALMRKNKIIVDNAEVASQEQSPNGSPLHVEQYANRLAADIVQSGKSLLFVHQDSFDYTNKDSKPSNRHFPRPPESQSKSIQNRADLENKRENFTTNDSLTICHAREVPLIQIETDQREEFNGITEDLISHSSSSGRTIVCQIKEKPSEINSEESIVRNTNMISRKTSQSTLDSEAAATSKRIEELPNHLSSSEESTGSWSQLVNDEDNPDDTSSFLQLSERSMSNGNSSTSSSLGMMDLEVYQEIMQPSTVINDLIEKKEFPKEQQENLDEHTSGLSVGTVSCQKDALVINFDLDPDCVDAELRTTLQWVAASELGIPTIYFKKSQENRIEKFLDVVRLVHQKSWKVADIFHAVVQYCKLQEGSKEFTPSLFDWLLELG
ncbi:A-kinase anchor protein SPHKAP [Microcaecilia unicolor]|uniref:A-kinase anchor protein SPHKAP n=1 Tax=Microcaecilia unicolor TaxID=1415580 RepID=A0A6P7ZBF6_9AMPH|nr:A-kinase anchor protein SPHKAP [Microcaecilia unicolor]